MKRAVSELYAYLIRFFMRAHDWYREGTWRRILHSVTRPPELRYGDLVRKIEECSETVQKLAVSCGQKELRGMHVRVNEISERMDAVSSAIARIESEISGSSGLRQASRVVEDKLTGFGGILLSAFLDTNDTLSDLQHSQILMYVTSGITGNQEQIYAVCQSMKNRRARSSQQITTNHFWNSPRLRKWSHDAGSDMTLVKGSYQSRLIVRDFAIGVIEQLQTAQVPILWVLKNPRATEEEGVRMAPVELLKHLSVQAISQNPTLRSEKGMALSCRQVKSAKTEREWFQVLEAALDGLGPHVYLVIDLDAVGRQPWSSLDFNLYHYFMAYFESRLSRGLQGRVKVLLTSCLAGTTAAGVSEELAQKKTVRVKCQGGRKKWRPRAGRSGFKIRVGKPRPRAGVAPGCDD